VVKWHVPRGAAQGEAKGIFKKAESWFRWYRRHDGQGHNPAFSRPHPRPGVDKAALRHHADSLRGPNQRATPRVATGYTSPSGRTYFGHSRHGKQIPAPLRAIMERIAPLDNRHGACGEIDVLIQAYEKEGISGITGGHFASLRVRSLASGGTAHGTPLGPCPDWCEPLLRAFGHTWE
jgi:hypothetical protein